MLTEYRVKEGIEGTDKWRENGSPKWFMMNPDLLEPAMTLVGLTPDDVEPCGIELVREEILHLRANAEDMPKDTVYFWS